MANSVFISWLGAIPVTVEGDTLSLTGNLTVSGAVTAGSVVTDTITERTTDAGVTVDGVLLKDSAVVVGDSTLQGGLVSVGGVGTNVRYVVTQTSTNATASAVVSMRRSREGAIVQSGDVMATLLASGYGGSSFIRSTEIMSLVDGVPATGDVPGRITFATKPLGGSIAERMRIDSVGNVGIGGTANANAILDVQSTTKAFMPPRMTTTQRDAIASPTAGMVIYNTTTNKLNVYTGSAWEAVTSS